MCLSPAVGFAEHYFPPRGICPPKPPPKVQLVNPIAEFQTVLTPATMHVSAKLAAAEKAGKPSFSFEFFPPKTAQGVQNLYDRTKRRYPLLVPAH